MPENHFTGRIAKEYETRWPHLFAPAVVDPAVDFLVGLTGAGDPTAALEFGIGTGRLALPLSRRGVHVEGIELSPDMVAVLREQPGADAISVTFGDFSTVRVEGKWESFALVYLVRNTIMNLTTQEQQIACFINAAEHLEPGGCFAIEVVVPELRRLPPGDTLRSFTATPDHLGFDEYDVATQGVVSHHYWLSDNRVETFRAPFRYVWPSELDLMARLAGMTLRERWGDWVRSPFTSESRNHISVWEKAADPARL